jgi:hypothetical protein
MRCPKCQGELERIVRMQEPQFNFCRECKLPFDDSGRLSVDTRSLNTSFNPLQLARGIIGKTHADASSVARTALEVLLIQGLSESYQSGLKDGVLLAYSQDVGEGEPYEAIPSADDGSG